MCGIAGAVRGLGRREAAERPPSRHLGALVERMSRAVSHRGPDGSGFWQPHGQEVVFAHRRLAIIDLSAAGAQPMIDAGTGCAVTFNGEIYNFLELRRELERLGGTFRSSSDTEVILEAYKHWGIDAVRRFRGIFALALWDPRARAVHLVRDPLGIKPLYYARVHDAETGEELLLFASELRALLAGGAVARCLNAEAVASYLWHGFVIGPRTIVAGVELLPAAGILTVTPGAADGGGNVHALRRYWQLPASNGRATSVGELGEVLRGTVRMQLVSDVPLGIFLSGGVDSSAVAALAAEAAPGALHTFNVGFEEAAYDESRWARQVAEAVGSRHTQVMLTEEDFAAQLDDAFTAIDQPTFDALNTYFVSRAARAAGMTVALAGTGGDELFGGYPTYVEIPRALRLGAWLPCARGNGLARRAFEAAVGAGARLAGGLCWQVLGTAPPQTRWGKLADAARAAHDALGLYQVAYALFTRETQAALAGDAVRAAQALQVHGLPPEVAAAWGRGLESIDPRHAVSLLELSSFIGERLLRDTDAASMAVALEVRVPLLDHVLAETVAGVDPARRFTPPLRKQLLRDVALGRLDPALFERPKSGFVLPIDTWTRRRLQAPMDALFADAALCARVGLDGARVQTLWRSFVAGRPGLYWSRTWALYVLLSWCRTHGVFLPA